jgi:hypothetical protein
MSERLLLDFGAFFLEHRLWGELDAGVDGPVVWFSCECGATIAGADGQARRREH